MLQTTIKIILEKTAWNEGSFYLMKDDYVEKIKNKYKIYDFSINDLIAEQLAYFYNLKIHFNQNQNEYYIKFDLKKSLKYKKDYLKYIAEKLNEEAVVHIADIHPGYYRIWLTQNGKMYAEYEGISILLGETPFNSIENLFYNKVKI